MVDHWDDGCLSVVADAAASGILDIGTDYLVVVRELASSRLTRRGTDSEPRQACFSSMTIANLIETKHWLCKTREQ